MSKKMVLQVDVVGDACKAEAMSAVAKLRGVKSMALDGDKLTVIGDVDVVCVARALRKAKFTPVVLTVGPEKEEKKEEKKDEKKDDKKDEKKDEKKDDKKDDKKEEKPDAGQKPADEPKNHPPCWASCPPPPPPPMVPWPGRVVCYEEPPQPGCVIL